MGRLLSENLKIHLGPMDPPMFEFPTFPNFPGILFTDPFSGFSAPFGGGGLTVIGRVHSKPRPMTKINCNSVLPNGTTIGQVVAQGRAAVQQTQGFENILNLADFGASTIVFAAYVAPHGPTDFKINFSGNATTLGQEGNFTYYATGSGFFPNIELDAGAGAYALYSAGRAQKAFSDLTGPMFSDSSAALVRGPALASNGCQQ